MNRMNHYLIVAATAFESLIAHFGEQDERGLILRALVLLAIGAAGVYLMLPRGPVFEQRRNRWIGAALATLSLVLLVTAPVSAGGTAGWHRTIFAGFGTGGGNVLFYVLAVISLASAVMMITSRNPVYSALWFALVLLSNSGLYLLVDAEFLSAATVIIYAGAIIVTFLFVIMLAQPSGAATYDRVSREPALACLAGVLLAAALVGTIHYAATVEAHPPPPGAYAETVRPTPAQVDRTLSAAPSTWRIQPTTEPRHVDGLGRTLFLDHYVSVEVIGLLLLAAVVGAMLIASHRLETLDGVREEK